MEKSALEKSVLARRIAVASSLSDIVKDDRSQNRVHEKHEQNQIPSKRLCLSFVLLVPFVDRLFCFPSNSTIVTVRGISANMEALAKHVGL
ncbi:MAG TPA: hypothetical protein VJ001_12015 [Rhodocyclaceae bacterium]|nr:hypothetical protein [Rhodocyclaceae bacterium]